MFFSRFRNEFKVMFFHALGLLAGNIATVSNGVPEAALE
jgi:hypothetical protein